MNNSNFEASEVFEKAYYRQKMSELFSLLMPYKNHLLIFEEVKKLLKPSGQNYLGVVTVNIDLIVGSEERYGDFNRTFLPRTKLTKGRWMAISKAYNRREALPAVVLYKLGGLYFVRDGHHRISVARMQGGQFIDAEVTELLSPFQLNKENSHQEIARRVIAYERGVMLEQSGLDKAIDMTEILFTEIRSYSLLLQDIYLYQQALDQELGRISTFNEAAQSWYSTVYKPVVKLIKQAGLLKHFKNRTEADLYIWVVSHWTQLKKRYNTIEKRTVVKYLADSTLDCFT